MSIVAAWAYLALATLPIVFQFALILGMPWGHLTQGGQVAGALPRRGRMLAALSVPVLVLMVLGVMSGAGMQPGWPRWSGWVATAVTALSFAANVATPSAAERRLWAPVVGAMLLAALAAMLG